MRERGRDRERERDKQSERETERETEIRKCCNADRSFRQKKPR